MDGRTLAEASAVVSILGAIITAAWAISSRLAKLDSNVEAHCRTNERVEAVLWRVESALDHQHSDIGGLKERVGKIETKVEERTGPHKAQPPKPVLE